FGPRVRNAVLKAAGIAPIDLHLQAVVVRGAAIHDGVDIAEAVIRAQKIIAKAGSRYQISILRMAKIRNRAVDQSCAIRNSIQISSLAQVPAERSEIADFHHCLETDVLLNADGEVVNFRRVRVSLETVHCAGSVQRSADEIAQSGNVAVIDRQSALQRWI